MATKMHLFEALRLNFISCLPVMLWLAYIISIRKSPRKALGSAVCTAQWLVRTGAALMCGHKIQTDASILRSVEPKIASKRKAVRCGNADRKFSLHRVVKSWIPPRPSTRTSV